VAWKGDADDLFLGWSQKNNENRTFTLAAKIVIAYSEWVQPTKRRGRDTHQ
jgi:hypothetical protein